MYNLIHKTEYAKKSYANQTIENKNIIRTPLPHPPVYKSGD